MGNRGKTANRETRGAKDRPRVVILGAGFGGLTAAKMLAKADVDVIVVDKKNHHLFQPLLYQVATASLSPAHIAAPIRRVLRKQRNASVVLGHANAVDTDTKHVILEQSTLPYDYLIVATGSEHSYFGHDDWAERAPGLKSIAEATEIRTRFLQAFERAEQESDDDARRRELTFVVVGAGPTGVELAGTMAEIAKTSIVRDYREIDTTTARVILIEGMDRALPTYPDKSSEHAKRQLEELGVEVILGELVTGMDDDGVTTSEDRRIEAGTVFWAAGVKAEGIGEKLGAETDKGGHVKVNPDLSIPDHPETLVIGDLALLEDPKTGEQIPNVAQKAIQMGRFAARLIRREVESGGRSEREQFHYVDKGMMATIGRNKAVANLRGRTFSGLPAWLLWAMVHVYFLIGFRNRLAVMWSWIYEYITFDRGARLITGEAVPELERPRTPEPEAAQEATHA